MKNNYNFKPFDKVLVRDYDHETWEANFFKSKKEICGKDVLYYCISAVWNQCIPYEGNEHLLGTTDSPEIHNSNKYTYFNIELKAGYVLEFECGEWGMIFPIYKASSLEEEKLGITFSTGGYDTLENIDETDIVSISKLVEDNNTTRTEYLWKKPNPKVIFTKAQIAEKLNLNVNNFEITD